MRLVAAAAVSWLICTLLAPMSAFADAGGERLFQLTDERITPSGGLASSTVHGGIVYTVGEPGGSVYALNSDGVVVAALRLDQTDPTDWEAVAPGPDQRIWVGRIGDDALERSEITLYRFREPVSLHDQGMLWSRFRLVYADGPHDAEALLVHPQTGQVFVVTKGSEEGEIYAGPPELASSEFTNTLTPVAAAPPLVTDGAFLPDGSGVVLLTGVKAYVYDYPSWDKRGELPTPVQPQGGSLAVSRDGGSILVGGTEPDRWVYQVPMTALAPTVEPATPTPTSSPTPSDQGAQAVDEGGLGETLNSWLGGVPWWIPAGALGIAALAGLATFPRSRRS